MCMVSACHLGLTIGAPANVFWAAFCFYLVRKHKDYWTVRFSTLDLVVSVFLAGLDLHDAIKIERDVLFSLRIQTQILNGCFIL
jgi:hypothetical protein